MSNGRHDDSGSSTIYFASPGVSSGIVVLARFPFAIAVGATLSESTEIIQYLLVFLFAAFPSVEILLVIPPAIGLRLNPILVGIVAFTGNVGSVYLLIAFHGRIARWRARRRGEQTDDTGEKRRYRWARRVWERYGLPGLAIAAPVLTGVHVATLLALAAGSSSRDVARWMTVGIAGWTVVLVVGSMYGVSLLGLG